MGDILFLAHRIPFPPDRGDKIRSHHLLKGLAKIAPVHVATFAESEADRAQERALAELAASHCLGDRSKPLPLAGAEAVLRGRPVSLTAFDHARLRRYVARRLAERAIDTIVVFSGQMGQYVPPDFVGRVVVDFCDVDSAKFAAYADAGERVWLNRREARLLAREEERLARRADIALLISENERALFRSQIGDDAGLDIRVLGNGIDADAFDPAAVEPHPRLKAGEGPHFVLTGQMDYRPNVEAAQWLARSVMPLLRRALPEARFHIVGRAPSDAVRALDGQHGTRVWGEVPDVRPFLRAADAVVAPLAIARGVQNKVLEAMAMARPVVLTPEAATGIAARDGEHFAVVARDPQRSAAKLVELTQDRQAAAAMGQAARRHVVDHASWPAVLAPLPDLVQGPAHGE